MSDYSVAQREEADDFMAEYPGFGELRSFGGAVCTPSRSPFRMALAAIQGLNAKVDEAIKARDATIAEQARDLAAQREELAQIREHAQAEMALLRRTLDALLARLPSDARMAQAH